VDDLMGKGLSIWVILELLVYASANLVPLAVPLAILLSSLMTFGSFAENNELTALKSSGLSLYKIMRPLMFIVIIISISTFSFVNYVAPVFNLKLHTLLYDIQNTKISSILTPGVYTKDFEGFSIKVDEYSDSLYKGITIHDYSHPSELKTVKAKEARIYKSVNGRYMFFDLKNGKILEELEIQNPLFLPDGSIQNPSGRPSRVSYFEHGTYKMDIAGFNLNRTDEDLFTDKYEMMNVFQISTAMDSLDKRKRQIAERFAKFGAPVVIAALTFMVYFMLSSVGENLAETHAISPFIGIWLAGFFFTPVAWIITRAASNDAQVFSQDMWKKLLSKLIKRNARTRT